MIPMSEDEKEQHLQKSAREWESTHRRDSDQPKDEPPEES